MPFPIAAAAVAGASLLGNLFTNRANRKQAEYAYGKQMEMMKYQNEYNKPINQMKRLQEAGLNPHLVYGNGNVTGNLTDNLPKYNAPEMRYDLGGAAQMGVSTLEAYQDMELKKATVDKVQADTVGQKIINANETVEGLKKSFELEHQKKLEPYQLDAMMYSVDKAQADLIATLKGTELKESELQTKIQQRKLIAAQIGMLDVSKREKEFILESMKKGIWPNTAGWIKIAYAIGQSLGLSMEQFKQKWTDKGFSQGEFEDSPSEREYFESKYGNKYKQ